jgi:hypothetical protein
MQDYDDEFPAPPTAEDVGVSVDASSSLPAPPPRDSSKDFMMEFRGSSSHTNANPRPKHSN